MKKLGIIELGTLYCKLTIANVQDNETFVITDQFSDAIRIASDLYEDWLIKPARTQELLVILKNYKLYCQTNEVEEVICVASCEYLDAKNHSSFIEELYNQFGFKFKILSQDEQIYNTYNSSINTVDVTRGLVISIYGNKTQISHYNRRNILEEYTFDFGSCNLAEYCHDDSLTPQEYCDKMYKKFLNELSEAPWLNEVDEDTQIVGVGEIFSSVGKLSRKLSKYPYDKEHNYGMNFGDFNKVYDFVKTLDIDKTKKLKGISSARADVLASGICIIKAILSKLTDRAIHVNANGITEGMLFSIASPITHEKPIMDILGYSLELNNTHYNFYSKNTSTVYSIAMMLYKQLKVLHKLPRPFIKVLRIAATLHDSGKRINCRNYEKLGFDVVLKSDLYGVTHREQVLAAFVVASQKSEDFNLTEFIKYKPMLEEEDLEAVKKLGILIRMANALDIFGKNKIQDITCDILGDSVILKTIVEVSAEMEIREALKCEIDFVKSYKKRLEIL